MLVWLSARWTAALRDSSARLAARTNNASVSASPRLRFPRVFGLHESFEISPEALWAFRRRLRAIIDDCRALVRVATRVCSRSAEVMARPRRTRQAATLRSRDLARIPPTATNRVPSSLSFASAGSSSCSRTHTHYYHGSSCRSRALRCWLRKRERVDGAVVRSARYVAYASSRTDAPSDCLLAVHTPAPAVAVDVPPPRGAAPTSANIVRVKRVERVSLPKRVSCAFIVDAASGSLCSRIGDVFSLAQ